MLLIIVSASNVDLGNGLMKMMYAIGLKETICVIMNTAAKTKPNHCDGVVNEHGALEINSRSFFMCWLISNAIPLHNLILRIAFFNALLILHRRCISAVQFNAFFPIRDKHRKYALNGIAFVNVSRGENKGTNVDTVKFMICCRMHKNTIDEYVPMWKW